MTSQPSRHCRHIGEDGIQCKAHPLVGRAYCFFHDPAMKKKRAAAGRDGGLMRGQRALARLKLPPDMFTRPLETVYDLADLLSETISRFLRGEIDARLAETITYMTNSLMHAWNKAPQAGEWPALGCEVPCPDTKEAMVELLQRDIAKVRALQADLEAGRE